MSKTVTQLKTKNYLGFTLIELLVVISIIGILIGLSVFGLQGARESSRDSRRKADLEQIRSGIEIFKSDCNGYPAGSGDPAAVFGSSLKGNDLIPACDKDNTYISQVPEDPISPSQNYSYYSDGTIYEICASLEQVQSGSTTCANSCGSSPCNYKVVNP